MTALIAVVGLALGYFAGRCGWLVIVLICED